MELIKKHFPSLSEDKLQQFKNLKNGVIDWNTKINVISRKEMDMLEEHHLLHSLAIAKFHSFIKGTRIIDVGTGGGFPGLPLAIMFPESYFTLVDSIGKKIRVVDELVELCGLKNVRTLNTRAENIQEKFDFVISRAVTSFPIFYTWTKGKISRESRNSIKNGIIALKGGDLSEELINFRKKVKIVPLSKWYPEQYFETKSVVYLEIP